MGLQVIYTTYPDIDTAKSIIRQLLEMKLIACANILPVHSLYTWKDEIADEPECLGILKSSLDSISKLESAYLSLHPYEVPCFVHWQADANISYLDWIIQSCLSMDSKSEKK